MYHKTISIDSESIRTAVQSIERVIRATEKRADKATRPDAKERILQDIGKYEHALYSLEEAWENGTDTSSYDRYNDEWN